MKQEKKLTLNILKESVVNNIGLPVIVIDKKIKSLRFNKKAAENFENITDADSFIALMDPSSAKRFRSAVKKVIETGKERSCSLDIKRKRWDARFFPARSEITLILEKNPVSVKNKNVLENRTLLDKMGDSFMLTDDDQNIIDVNDAVCRALGYSRAEMLNMNASQFDTLLSNADIKRIHRKADKGPYTFDTKNIDKKGETIFTEVNMFPMTIRGKKYYGSIGRNITEFKLIQSELEESNRKLSNITNATHDALWEVNMETGERWSNEVHQRLYGLTKDDPMPDSKEWEKHIHPEDRKKIVAAQDEAVNRKQTALSSEYRFRISRNHWIYIYDRTLLYYSKEGNLEKMMGSMVDITELRKAQEALKTQRDLSEGIINALPGIFYLLDKNGNFIKWNQNFETVTGFSTQEIHSMKPSDFFYSKEADQLSQKIEEVFQQGWAEMEGNLINKSGEGKPYYLSGWRTIVGNQECLIGTGIDLSEIKKAQESIKRMELRIAEQKIQDQKVISRAIISAQEKERNHIGKELHDNVNQLLAGARLYLTMGAKKNPGYSEMIKYPLELLDNGIQEIRALTHHHISPSKDMDLKQLSEGIADLLKAASINCKLEYDLKVDIPENLLINIYRILQEEANNILKHSEAKNVSFKIKTKDGSILISTIDDGKGFDIHKQREGIGISNIFNRVESYNGMIEITSSPGKGCSTEIQIPIPDYMQLYVSQPFSNSIAENIS